MDLESARLKLQTQLEGLFPGIPVIFRPLQSHKLQYPCVVYDVSENSVRHANNKPYILNRSFTVTVMSQRSGLLDSSVVLDLPNSSNTTTFSTNDVVQDVYKVSI